MTKIWQILTDDLRSMSRQQHFWYWIFPLALLGLLMLFFFSGVTVLVEIVNPKTTKEWGLLENIQLVIIVVMIGVSMYAIAKKKPILQKLGFGFVTVFAVFVFLEEISYGAHLTQYFTGDGKSQLAKLTGVYNIHNYGDSTAKIFKRSVYVLMLFLFIIAPFVKSNFQNRIISYLIPLPKIVIAAILTILCEITARILVLLNDLNLDDLTMDIGEFSEILVYYIFLLYLWQLIFEKEWVMRN